MGRMGAGSARFDTLALIGTYQCDLRCHYCPVVKADCRMPRDIAAHALRVAAASGIRRFRMAGADPFSYPELLSVLLESTPDDAVIRITSNGVRLGSEWISRLAGDGRVRLVISVDGNPESHRENRRGSSDEVDSFSWFERHHRELAAVEGITVNVVIAPTQAAHLMDNVMYLSRHGFFRLNLLPAYYVEWSEPQKRELAASFRRLAAFLDRARDKGLPYRIVNAETTMPQPLYRAEWVVDVDGRIYDSDMIAARLFEVEKHRYALGNIATLEDFASLENEESPPWESLIAARLGNKLWADTRAVDALLTDFVRRLTGS